MRIGKKRCHFCGRWYPPNPRTARLQVACLREGCRRARRTQARRRWQAMNPGYGKGRKVKVKAWASAYPNYWQAYRAKHGAYVSREKERMRLKRGRGERVAKQDAIRRQTLDRLRVLEGWTTELTQESVAKQDTIPPVSPCETRVSRWMEGVVGYLGWKECVAKQDAIAKEPLAVGG